MMLCTAGFGHPLDDALAVLVNPARPFKQRAGVGAELMKNLASFNGSAPMEARDYEAIAQSALILLDDKEALFQEVAACLLLAVPPTKFHELALPKVLAAPLGKGYAVRLVAAKGLTTPEAIRLLQETISMRPDTSSFELAATEASKRQMLDMKGDLVAALADKRTGIQLAAARALAGFPNVKGAELPKATLQLRLAEAEAQLRKSEEFKMFLPQSGAAPLPTQWQLLVEALKGLLQAPTEGR
ncbi:hypothetical protein [Verrucomicrobium sp. BvORR106]|uniref:hypothetical protein n=1 Tax=Verrucomicrobium sp. BvORR106 TaxID=1403819 RepID=UPI002240FFDF|nr:hypothetical protein [Verrucomicrobium sp. BvORR106]